MENSKPFSQKLYDENNNKAITVARHYFEQKGYSVIVPDNEQYSDYDILVVVRGKEIPIELEVKKVWMSSGFWEPNWPTLDVPYRKRHSKAGLYVLFNNKLDTLIRMTMAQVKAGSVITKDTIYTKNEKFFSIPMSNIYVETIVDGKWIRGS